ncbi:MAG: ABC transporter permease [Nanoarchaeota archaeon]
MIDDYFGLAFKNLKHRGIRSWLTLLGIFIGVAAVVSLVMLGNGLKAGINSQFGVSSTEVITVQAGGLNSYGPPGSGVENKLTKDDADAIEKLSTIDVAIGRNIETFKIEFNDKTEFTPGFGLAEGEKKKWDYEMQGLSIEKGKLLNDNDNKTVLLGNNYMYKDKSGFDKEIETRDRLIINNKSFRVIGILEKKGSFLLDNIIIINNNDLENLVNNNDSVDIISVKVKNKDLMDKAKTDIEKLMRDRRDVKKGEEDFEVSTPESSLESVNSILNAIQIFIIIIASISILVGSIGIINTMTTSVLERKKEIGIMKAIGATNNQIFFQFLIESGLMGLIGSLIGVIFGILIGYIGTLSINNFIGAETKPVFDFVFFISVLIGGFIIGSLSGIFPALNASKQNPVEVLRK